MLAVSHEEEITNIFRELINGIPDWIKPITQGVMTHKFLVGIQDKKYIVRFYPKGREHIAKFEPDVIQQCRSMGIKVPNVYIDSRNGPKCDSNYMIYEFIEGYSLSSQLNRLNQNQLMAVCGEIVEALGKMAQIRIQGYGDLISKCRGADASWEDFIKASFHQALSIKTKLPFCSTEQFDKLVLLSNQLDIKYSDVDPNLVYSDLRPENIILTPDMKLAAIIDFEGVLSGDPLLSLGYCYASSGDNPFFNVMAMCWTKKIGEIDWRRLDIYSVLRILRIAKHIDEPLPTGKERDPLDKSFPGFFKSIDRLGLLI